MVVRLFLSMKFFRLEVLHKIDYVIDIISLYIFVFKLAVKKRSIWF